ncbi:dihydroorotate dehydrogenase [Candidatus Thorarchaeota archaeon]|nr:MAG: dihydroorotate dehydrogenase [Candidatus Thorarchaeota archaeon]
MKRVHRAGADVVVTKSIGIEPREGHPGPVITASHGGLLNAIGLTNPGIDGFLEEIDKAQRGGVPVVVSVFGATSDDIASVAETAASLDPIALELNLSCPHAEFSQVGHKPDMTMEYVRAVKRRVDCMVLAKLTPNASDVVAVAKGAEEGGADAIVAVNTLRGMRIDIQQRRPVLGNKVGGLSGPPIFPVAVRCIYDLYDEITVPIIGVGGVASWEDAVEMHLAGASAIQIGTAALGGLDVFERIRRGVDVYLESHGFSDITEIIGEAKRS